MLNDIISCIGMPSGTSYAIRCGLNSAKWNIYDIRPFLRRLFPLQQWRASTSASVSRVRQILEITVAKYWNTAAEYDFERVVGMTNAVHYCDMMQANDTCLCYLSINNSSRNNNALYSLSVHNRKLIPLPCSGERMCSDIKSIPGSEANTLSIHVRYSWTRMLELYLLRG